jgi:hypothetical protein
MTKARYHIGDCVEDPVSQRIPKDEVLHIFPVTDRSKWGGPTLKEVRRARKAIPKTELVP